MANDENINKTCPKHGPQEVVGIMRDPKSGISHINFQCGCIVEAVEKILNVGDAVMWSGELYRLDDIDGTIGIILNIYGEKRVVLNYLKYIGKDTLTSAKKIEVINTEVKRKTSHRHSQSWDPDEGYSYENASWHAPPRTKSRHETTRAIKKDSISTSSLIENEVKELKKEEGSHTQYNEFTGEAEHSGNREENKNSRPLKTKAPTQKSKSKEDAPTHVVTKRKGVW